VTTASARRAAAPPTRRDEARALFRNAILEAAEAVFAERGFHRARIQDIARHARIAVGTVYNHFEQKEDVLRELFEERTVGFIPLLEVHAGDPSDFEGSLRSRLERVLRYVEMHRAFFTVAADHGLIGAGSTSTAELLGRKTSKSVARVRALFVGIVEEGIAGGVLDPSDPVALARVLGALVRAFTIGKLQEDREAPLANDVDSLVHLFLHGASRHPAKAPKRAR
jgi:AcrR family transcriptional regulator